MSPNRAAPADSSGIWPTPGQPGGAKYLAKMTDSKLFDMPPQFAGLDARAGWLVNRLLAEASLGLTNPIHAAAIVGNLGGESGLLAINERHPIRPGSRGGWSWAQWTGPRRNQFEAYAKSRGLGLDSDRAAYEFLVRELLGPEAAALRGLKKATTLEAAVETFEVLFERPSDPQGGLPSRIAFAKQALAAASASPDAPPTTRPSNLPESSGDDTIALSNIIMDSLIRALQANAKLDGLYDGEPDGIPGPKTFQAMTEWWQQRGAKETKETK